MSNSSAPQPGSHITANGISMRYRMDGPEDAPVVMFSNSLISSCEMWDSQVAAVSSTYRMLRYDTRGHGGTETTPGPYTIELLADDVIALLDGLGLDRVHFVGLSMGGMIGQVLGARNADRIRSLVLSDTASHMPDKEIWSGRMATAEKKGIEALIEPTVERWFTPPFMETGRAQVNAIRDMIRQTGVDGYVACSSAIRDMDLNVYHADILVPTLVLVGENDPATPPAAGRHIHENIGGSLFEMIGPAAHLPNIEQAEHFNKCILDFIGENAGA